LQIPPSHLRYLGRNCGDDSSAMTSGTHDGSIKWKPEAVGFTSTVAAWLWVASKPLPVPKREPFERHLRAHRASGASRQNIQLSKERAVSVASSFHCCICPDTSTSSSECLLRQTSFPEAKGSPYSAGMMDGRPTVLRLFALSTAPCIAPLDPPQGCWRHHHLRTWELRVTRAPSSMVSDGNGNSLC